MEDIITRLYDIRDRIRVNDMRALDLINETINLAEQKSAEFDAIMARDSMSQKEFIAMPEGKGPAFYGNVETVQIFLDGAKVNSVMNPAPSESDFKMEP